MQIHSAGLRGMVAFAAALLTAIVPVGASADDPSSASQLRVGHWLEVRGLINAEGIFVAERAEITQEPKYELLIGEVATNVTDPLRFTLLGQPIQVSEKTDWKRINPGQIAGLRVKVEGYYRGPRKLSARSIKPWGPGRSRVAGRIDEILSQDGDSIEVRIMNLHVRLPETIRSNGSIDDFTTAEQRHGSGTPQDLDEDDLFGEGITLGGTLRLSGQFEVKGTLEENFDLADPRKDDRANSEFSTRLRLEWRPLDWIRTVTEVRHRQLYRDDDRDGHEFTGKTVLGETYTYLTNPFGLGVDVVLGRQDFDDRREWIYDQNLDALRLVFQRPSWQLDLSVSTTLANGNRFDENSTNVIAYLANRDVERHRAVYVVHRALRAEEDSDQSHFGLRVLGDNAWIDLAGFYAARAGGDTLGVGFDVGKTWTPKALDPLSFTLAYAFGSGGEDEEGTDHVFRQTGFQDNNAKFDGVTSFRYYGELSDPELSNLQILTVGVGARVARRTSVDLVVHHYRQHRPSRQAFENEVSRRPNGVDKDLGWETNLIFGSRRWEDIDLEIVGAVFDAGQAFDRDDAAYLGKFQMRFRF